MYAVKIRKETMDQTPNMSNFLHEWYSQFLILPMKIRYIHNMFGKKLRVEDVLLIYFDQIYNFCTQIQTNSNYFVNNNNIFRLN